MNDLADLETTDAGDGLVVARIRGDLDLSNLYSMHTALLEMLPNEADCLVVDLGGVTFLDSSGVEALFRLQTSLEVRQQRLAIAIPVATTLARARAERRAGRDAALRERRGGARGPARRAGARRAGDGLGEGRADDYDWVGAHCASARSPSAIEGGVGISRRVAQVPLGVQRGLAARARGGDRLAVGVVDEVAGREDARLVGPRRAALDLT